MADFAQLGPVPTLHLLTDRPFESLASDLRRWSPRRPMTLVIPTLFQELERPALARIVDIVAEASYLDEVVIGLDDADAEAFEYATRFFAPLAAAGLRCRVLWQDGPRLRSVDDELGAHGFAPAHPGKGRNVWYCLGYVLASGRADVVAVHDADIRSYDAALLARLLYPVAHPDFGYRVAKGFYHRSDEATFNGRVSRLLMAPLLRALRSVAGPTPYLDHLSAFRYPLAGEISLDTSLAAELLLPTDWGLEVGVLGEIQERCRPREMCQVAIASAYDHKHQPLSPDDAGDGLHRMAVDIASTVLGRLQRDGVVLSRAMLEAIRAEFVREGAALIEVYHHDAVFNGLTTTRSREAAAVAVFDRAIGEAGRRITAPNATATTMAPWSVVFDAVPDVGRRLVAAVEADAADQERVSPPGGGRR
ncbi:MAG: glycosyl transferase [Actinomycetota bacterium]